MVDIFGFYKRMEQDNIMLSFTGNINPDLLLSILQIMEIKLEQIDEGSKLKKKIYNILVECLQHVYHLNEYSSQNQVDNDKSAIFMVGKTTEFYKIITGNYILADNVADLKEKITHINSLSKDHLKDLYMQTLNNGDLSEANGLGLIDIARRSGNKLDFEFYNINKEQSFFTLGINISLS